MATLWILHPGTSQGITADAARAADEAVYPGADIGDILHDGHDEIRQRLQQAWPDAPPETRENEWLRLWRWLDAAQPEDHLLAFFPESNTVLFGEFSGNYRYAPDATPLQRQRRPVMWDEHRSLTIAEAERMLGFHVAPKIQFFPLEDKQAQERVWDYFSPTHRPGMGKIFRWVVTVFMVFEFIMYFTSTLRQ